MQLNDQGLYDIYPLWHVPFWQQPLFWVVMALPCVLILAALIVMSIRKKTAKQLPPWTVALDLLNRLEAQVYADGVTSTQLYTQLLMVLKSYLDTRYGLQLSTKTDDELIGYLKNQASCQAIVADMEKLCHGAVLVKYANRPLEAPVLKERINQAKLLIQQTIPQQQAAS